MVARASLIAVIMTVAQLAGCQGSPRLHGAWRSNEELTRQGIRKEAHDLSQRAREILLERPNFFGQLIHVYVDGTAYVIFEGECQPPTPYFVKEGSAGELVVEFPEFDHEIIMVDDRYGVGLPWLGSDEIFTRVDLSEILAQHECLRVALGVVDR